MSEQNLDKMLLGELISELLKTRSSISATFNIKDGDSKADEMMRKRGELQNYENQIYAQLNKKEEDYMMHHPETRF